MEENNTSELFTAGNIGTHLSQEYCFFNTLTSVCKDHSLLGDDLICTKEKEKKTSEI